VVNVSRGWWVALLVLGILVTLGAGIWLFRSQGAEQADHISSVVSAGIGIVGILTTIVGTVQVKRKQKPDRDGVSQSVDNSTISGSNIQVGGSVEGSITATQGEGEVPKK
jgi:hypothetical protein